MSDTFQAAMVAGHLRIFSLLPRTARVGDPHICSGVLGVGDAPVIIPRKNWPAEGVNFSDEVWRIRDQNGFSLCHSFGGATVAEIAHERAGHRKILLSAGSLAGQVTGHQDDGAAIQDVLPVLRDNGLCPASLIDENDYKGRNWPKGWEVEAAKYRAEYVWDCGQGSKVFDSIVTCLLLGWPVLLGTSAFGGGHAVAVTGYQFDGTKVRLFGPNSWGEQYKGWDLPGFWSYTESQLRDVSNYGAFGVQLPASNPDDNPPAVEV